MSGKLEVTTQIADDQIYVQLNGSIDEDADFSKLKELNGSKFVFDFDKVEMINSCGIRDWINFIEELGDNTTIVYSKCPQIIIEQINMVHGFIRKGAAVESFYAPYFCESKDEERKVLLMTKDIQDRKAPVVKDEETGEELEFDAIEEQYFSFLNK